MQVTTPWQAVDKPLWWRRNLALGIGLLAAVLAGSALVSWVAANWVQMRPQARLALVQGVLALTVVLGAALAWLGSRWAGVLTGVAALATGALLALIGQIYQTGADRWQLFLLWAVLITPWLLLVRSVFLALLWAALLNLAVWLWADGGGLWSWFEGGPAAGVWLVALNAGLLSAAECGRRFLRDPWRLVRRVLAAVILAWAFNVVALGSVGQGDYPRVTQDLLLGLLPVAILYAVYGHWRRDLAVVALALLVGIGQVGALWVRMLDSLDGVLGLAVLLLALVWLAAHHLLHLRRAGMEPGPVADAATAGPGLSLGEVLDSPDAGSPGPELSPPWYLTVLRVGVLIPVLLLLGFWVALSFDLDSAADALAAGVMLMCPGLLMARLARRSAWRELGGVLGVLGLLLCAGSVLFLMGEGDGWLTRLWILAAAGGAVYVFSPQFSIRLVAACLALGIGFWLSAPEADYFGGPADAQGVGASQLAWRLWMFLAAGIGLWVWSARAPHRVGWRPLAWALLAVAAGAALLLAASMQLPAREWPWFGQLAMFLCALLPGLLLAAWMAAARPVLPITLRAGAPLAACVAGLGWVDIPALSVALVWLALGRLSGGRVLQALAVPLGLLGLLAYYLNTGNGASLLDKAMILGLTAAWLAGATAVLAAPLRRGVGLPARRSPWLPAGLLAGGVLVLGVAQGQVHQYETLLAQGRPVVLALAPVDPRSLMQGDYMALDYVVRRTADDWLRTHESDWKAVRRAGGGWLQLRRDDQGVWQLQGIVVDQPPAATSDTIALAFRWRHGFPDFGADSWFFPEGQGERFAGARYGVLRVAPDGAALLAGLLDAQQQPL